jgi:hypothetical protein
MRRFLAAINLLVWAMGSVWAAPAAAIDMPGSDYASFDAPTVYACRDSCGGDSKCQAFTWVKPGIQGASGRCWLKNAVPASVANNCCQSGTHRNMSPSDMRPEMAVDRPGADFKNFDVDSSAGCESACTGDNTCRSWTFVAKGVQGPRARCWLKNAIPNPVPNPKTVSGVKYKGASVRFD